jgi:hypothetical protein
MLRKLGPDRIVAELRRLPDALRRLPETVRQLPARARALTPADWLHLVSMVVVWVVALQWLRVWYDGNHEILWDPKLQPDDARTAIFPFHRYSSLLSCS